MEVDYYSKYLKYKAKYLELKAQLGAGGSIGCHKEKTICKNKDCGIACKKKDVFVLAMSKAVRLLLRSVYVTIQCRIIGTVKLGKNYIP